MRACARRSEAKYDTWPVAPGLVLAGTNCLWSTDNLGSTSRYINRGAFYAAHGIAVADVAPIGLQLYPNDGHFAQAKNGSLYRFACNDICFRRPAEPMLTVSNAPALVTAIPATFKLVHMGRITWSSAYSGTYCASFPDLWENMFFSTWNGTHARVYLNGESIFSQLLPMHNGCGWQGYTCGPDQWTTTIEIPPPCNFRNLSVPELAYLRCGAWESARVNFTHGFLGRMGLDDGTVGHVFYLIDSNGAVWHNKASPGTAAYRSLTSTCPYVDGRFAKTTSTPGIFDGMVKVLPGLSSGAAYNFYSAAYVGYNGSLWIHANDVTGLNLDSPGFYRNQFWLQRSPAFDKLFVRLRGLNPHFPLAWSDPACPLGVSVADAPASNCFPCMPGTTPDNTTIPGAYICSPCPPGFYSGIASACTPCPVGLHAPLAGASTCVPCGPGFVAASVTGSSFCLPCPAPLYSPNGTSCLVCPPGLAAAGPGLSSCSLCGAGQTSNASGCYNCPPGTYGGTTGVARCDDCGLNRFSPRSGLSTQFECQLCPLYATTGTVTNASSADQCFCQEHAELVGSECMCVQGYELDVITLRCARCAGATQYKIGTSNNVCLTCPLYSLAKPDSSGCDCSPNFVHNPLAAPADPADPNSLACVCPPGREISPAGCDLCGSSSFKQDYSIATCTACPLNAVGSANRTSCVCAPGLFRLSTNEKGPVCIACPANAVCFDATIVADRGYWVAPRASVGLAPSVLECVPAEACLGGNVCSSKHMSGSVACSECADGLKKQLSGKCIVCKGGSPIMLFLYGLLGMAFAIYVYRVGNSLNAATELVLMINALQLISQASISSYLASSVLSVADLSFTTSFLGDICTVGSNFETIWLLAMLLPFFLIAFMVLFVCATMRGPLARTRVPAWLFGRALAQAGLSVRSTLNAAVCGFFLTTFTTIRTAFIMLRCRSINGVPSLFVASHVRCWTASHSLYAAIAVSVLGVFLLATVVMAAIGVAARYRASRNSVTAALAAGELHAVWRVRHPVLFGPYSMAGYAWELVVVSRRVVVALVTQLLYTTSVVVKLMVVAVTLIAYLLVQQRFQPFARYSHNTLEETLLSSEVLVVVLFVVVSTASERASRAADVLALLVVISVVLICLMQLGHRLRSTRKLAPRDHESDELAAATATPSSALLTAPSQSAGVPLTCDDLQDAPARTGAQLQ